MKNSQVSDLNDKTILVTGATNGIGKQTVEHLARTGATLVIVGRNPEKTETLVKTLQAAPGAGQVHGMLADLSCQDEVRKLATEFKSKFSRLDILVNNAGAIFTTHETTADGFERTWALNHLNYFLLTTLLKDVLMASAPSRVINVASDAHKPGKMLWDDLQYKNSTFASGWPAYCQSKLANILFTKELSTYTAQLTIITCIISITYCGGLHTSNSGDISLHLYPQ